MSRILLMCCLGLFLCANVHGQSLKFTEIMYNPPESPDTFEYFEIYNTTSSSISLAGYTFVGVNYTVPKGVSVPGKGRIVFCKDSLRLDGITNSAVAGWQWTSGGLNNSGEELAILDTKGKIVDSVNYSSSKPWPQAANGKGSSLVLCDETKSEHGPANWTAATNFIAVVNGYSMRGNPGTGCSSSSKDTTPPVIVKVYTSSSHHIKIVFNEPVNAGADSLHHYTGFKHHIDSARRCPTHDTVTLYLPKSLKDGQYYSITIDSISDSAGNMLTTPYTYRFLFNGLKSGIKITELMYNAPGKKHLGFIELYNYSTDTLPLGGLNFTKGIVYTLPAVLLQPGHYFLIARDSLAFDSFYFKVSKMHAYQWPIGQKLSNSGGSIHLKNTTGDFIDTFFYDVVYPWPAAANGGGSSLVLCNAFLDNSTATNWSQSYDYVDTVAGLKIYASPGKKCGGPSYTNPVRLITKLGRSFCGPIKLDAGNVGSVYRWNNDSASTTESIIADKPGKYVVVIVNGYGGVVDSVTLNPFIVSANIPDTACSGSTVKFFDNSNVPSNAVRIWNLGDTTSSIQNPTRVYDSAGIWSISLKVSDAYCSDSVMKNLNIVVCTGIEKAVANAPILKISPNPSNGSFDIYFTSEKSTESALKIYDAYGRIVYSSNINASGNANRINLQNLPKGMYFMNVTSNAEMTTSKLVIY